MVIPVKEAIKRKGVIDDKFIKGSSGVLIVVMALRHFVGSNFRNGLNHGGIMTPGKRIL